MEMFSHLWQYVAEFFLEWEMYQMQFVEKIKIHILRSVPFPPPPPPRKSRRLWDNVEKYGGATEDEKKYSACLWHPG
jgi:hypothetical protein